MLIGSEIAPLKLQFIMNQGRCTSEQSIPGGIKIAERGRRLEDIRVEPTRHRTSFLSFAKVQCERIVVQFKCPSLFLIL